MCLIFGFSFPFSFRFTFPSRMKIEIKFTYEEFLFFWCEIKVVNYDVLNLSRLKHIRIRGITLQ